MTGGHIRQRAPNSFEIRFPLPPGPDGKRRVGTKTIRGSKKDAKRALREAMGEVDRGQHVDRNPITVGEHVRRRIEHWQAVEQIGARGAENYSYLGG